MLLIEHDFMKDMLKLETQLILNIKCHNAIAMLQFLHLAHGLCFQQVQFEKYCKSVVVV
jgi:hypothetical protein